MSFRNRIVRISQLIADKIIGAQIQTGTDSEPRIVLVPTVKAGGTTQFLNFYTADLAEVGPAYIDAQMHEDLLTHEKTPELFIVAGEAGGAGGNPATIGLFSPTAMGSPGVVQIVNGLLKLSEGQGLAGIAFGKDTVTFTATNKSNQGVAHGLSAAPSAVFIVPVSGAAYIGGVNSVNATTFNATLRHYNDVAVTTSVDFYWLALLG